MFEKELIEQPPLSDENEATKKARKLYASCMDRSEYSFYFKYSTTFLTNCSMS